MKQILKNWETAIDNIRLNKAYELSKKCSFLQFKNYLEKSGFKIKSKGGYVDYKKRRHISVYQIYKKNKNITQFTYITELVN